MLYGTPYKAWAAARSVCQALSGGDLVVYESYTENSMVGGLRAAGLERGTRLLQWLPPLACQRAAAAPWHPPFQVEAYFQNGGRLGLGTPWYWMGVTRQSDSSLLLSKAAAGKRYLTVTGTPLPFYAPSNGPLEGPAFAPYAHWSAWMFGANR